MVANSNSTLLFENKSLIWNLKVFARKHGLSYLYIYFSLFFQAGIGVPIVLFIWTLVHFFQYFLFLNNFCIAHASLLQ
jgi:hypothetical protein